MTKYAVVTIKGGLEALKDELKKLNLSYSEGGSAWLEVEWNEEDYQNLLIKSQTTTRILQYIGKCDSKEELVELARKQKPEGTFAVRAIGPDRQILEIEIGGEIKEASKGQVNLTKPDVTYFIVSFEEHFLFGIDLSGDISKRHYKIISGAHSLSGPVAMVTLSLAKWKPGTDLLVWPCATGELAIEAALQATEKSPRAYELKKQSSKESDSLIVAADPRLSLVSSAQKNAKIAGIHSSIRFSRQDLDWLDTKHDEKGVDSMVGLLPNLREHKNFTKELYYQLDYILADKGSASFLCVNDDSALILEEGAKSAERKYDVSRLYLWAGQHPLTLVTLKPASSRKPKAKNKSEKQK